MTESLPETNLPRLRRALGRLLRDPLVWVVGGLTAVVCVALVFDLVPALRGPLVQPPQWRWGHIWPPDVRARWLALPLGAGAGIGAVLLATRQRARLPGWALLALVVLTLGFQLGTQHSQRSGLSVTSRTLNPAYFGYFPPAAEIRGLSAFLREYPALVKDWDAPTRLLTHPPGNVLGYWLVVRLFEGFDPLQQLADRLLADRLIALPPWVEGYTAVEVLAGTAAGLLVAGLAALSVLPLYALARRTGGERSARLAVGLYPFIPALTLFLPVVDMAYTLLAVGALWLTVSAMQEDDRRRLALAGLVLGIGTFCSFGLLPLGLMAGIVVLLYRVPPPAFGHRRGARGRSQGILAEVGNKHRAGRDWRTDPGASPPLNAATRRFAAPSPPVERGQARAYARAGGEAAPSIPPITSVNLAPWRALLLDGLALAAGSLLVWGIAWAAWGLNPLVLYRNGLAAHAGLTLTRSYGLWLGYNLWDVLLFAGLPLAVHVVRGLARFAGRLIRRDPLRDGDRLLLAFVGTMGLVWISGSVRGETARILLFVTPLLAWLGGRDVAGDSVRPAGYGFVLAALMAFQTVVMQAALRVYH